MIIQLHLDLLLDQVQLTGANGAQVLRDGEVSKSTRAARAQGLKLLGQLFCDAAEVATLKQAGQVRADDGTCFEGVLLDANTGWCTCSVVADILIHIWP